MPSGPVEHDEGMGAGFDVRAISARWAFSASVLALGMTRPAALPLIRADGGEDIGRGRPPVLGR